jgi:acyl-CoA synthetase (AMP-forming)/AMP-acid ligase II
MRYPEIFAAIDGITSPEGPFPILEQEIDGVSKRVFGGLPGSLRDYFAFAASHGEKECLIDRERRMSFNDVAQQVARLGAALTDQYGVNKGDRVAIAMRNSPEWCISFMAITSVGAVAVPMNSWWQGDELAYGLQDCGARHIILDAARYQRLAPHIPGSGLVVIGLENEGKTLPPEVDRLESVMSGEGGVALPEVAIDPEDPAMILYTSGSTGRPRGVLSTQRNVLSALGTWLVAGTAAAMAAGTFGQEPEEQPSDSAHGASVPCDWPEQPVSAVTRHRAQDCHDVQVGHRCCTRVDTGGEDHALQWCADNVDGVDESSSTRRIRSFEPAGNRIGRCRKAG